MGLNNSALEYIYKHKSDSFQWLKKYECVHFVDTFYECTTERTLLDDIHSAYIELTKHDRIHSYIDIIKTIIQINTEQLNFLDRYKKRDNSSYLIKQHHDEYMNDDGTYPTMDVVLKMPSRIIESLRTRNLCLYFNSEKPGAPGAYGTNGIDIYIMAVFMEKLIHDKKSIMFNNFFVVPRYPDRFPSVLEKWMYPCNGSEFIHKTCFFTNTVYMHGLGVSGDDAGSIPIVGLMTQLDNQSLKKSVSLPFFATGQQIVDGVLTYNTIDKIYHNKVVVSQAEAISQTNLVSKARNTTVYNVCKYFHRSLRQLENMYSTFDII